AGVAAAPLVDAETGLGVEERGDTADVWAVLSGDLDPLEADVLVGPQAPTRPGLAVDAELITQDRSPFGVDHWVSGVLRAELSHPDRGARAPLELGALLEDCAQGVGVEPAPLSLTRVVRLRDHPRSGVVMGGVDGVLQR